MSTYIKLKDNDPNALTHYGVKGMKWHKRKKYGLITHETTIGNTVYNPFTNNARRGLGEIKNNMQYYKQNPVKARVEIRKHQIDTGSSRVRSIAYKMKNNTGSNVFKRTAKKGKSIILRFKTKRAAKKMIKSVREA